MISTPAFFAFEVSFWESKTQILFSFFVNIFFEHFHKKNQIKSNAEKKKNAFSGLKQLESKFLFVYFQPAKCFHKHIWYVLRSKKINKKMLRCHVVQTLNATALCIAIIFNWEILVLFRFSNLKIASTHFVCSEYISFWTIKKYFSGKFWVSATINMIILHTWSAWEFSRK